MAGWFYLGAYFLSLCIPSLFSLLDKRGGIIKVFFYFLLIMYSASYSALSFYLSSFLTLFFSASFSLCVGFAFLFIYQEYGFFLILGAAYGNPFLNPLVPLAFYPFLFFFLPLGGIIASLFLLLITSWSCAEVLYFLSYPTTPQTNKRQFRVFCSVFLFSVVIWLSGLFLTTSSPPTYDALSLKSCCYAPPCKPGQKKWSTLISSMETAVSAFKKNEHLRYIIWPESAYDCDLYQQPYLLKAWYELIPPAAILIMGAPRKDYEVPHQHMHTSVLVIKNALITDYHDKTILMPLAEYLPSVATYFYFFKNIIKKNSFPQRGQHKKRKCLNSTPFISYLCSEFFFSHIFEGTNEPILCLAHDDWFRETSLPTLMYLKAQMESMMQKRVIVYCSYHYATIFDPQGISYCIRNY